MGVDVKRCRVTVTLAERDLLRRLRELPSGAHKIISVNTDSGGQMQWRVERSIVIGWKNPETAGARQYAVMGRTATLASSYSTLVVEDHRMRKFVNIVLVTNIAVNARRPKTGWRSKRIASSNLRRAHLKTTKVSNTPTSPENVFTAISARNK